MNDMDIPEDAGIAIEYNIPRTAMRVDFIITGRDAQEKPNAILIELKQWDKLKLVSDKSILPVIDFRPELIHCHDWPPLNYADYYYLEALKRFMDLKGISYKNL